MLHTTLIALHALSGVIAFLTGCLAVQRRSYFRVYFWSLASLVLSLAAAIAVSWTGLGTPMRALFVAFVALGGYMVWRAVQARRILLTSLAHPTSRYLDHLGFTLVALFDGFAVIAVFDLGAPGWLAAVVGVAVAGGGHVAIRTLKSRLAPRPPAEASASGYVRP
ncbi:MAG: hypothetical protein ACRDN9_03540 [Streptosporangiaceae bacterium]